MTRKSTKAAYLKLREERDNLPGIIVVGGHVVSDRFGEMYGTGPMRDDELPIELRTQDSDRVEAIIATPRQPLMSPREFLTHLLRECPHITAAEIVKELAAAGYDVEMPESDPPDEP